MGRNTDYQSLSSEEDLGFVPRRRGCLSWNTVLLVFLLPQAAILWGILFTSLIQNAATHKSAGTPAIPVFGTDYYELQGWVPYIVRAFNNHIRPDRHNERYVIEFEEGEPQYVGEPRPEIDEAWEDVLSAINFNRSGEFAKPILHQTYQYPDGNHLVGLEVYHALHCINNIRKTLHYDHYVDDFPPSKQQWETHIAHCLDYLRQYVQCNADLTPFYFENVGVGGLIIRRHVEHTCRDFSRVHEWVRDRL